jgi:hypothetical protein
MSIEAPPSFARGADPARRRAKISGLAAAAFPRKTNLLYEMTWLKI